MLQFPLAHVLPDIKPRILTLWAFRGYIELVSMPLS